MQSRCAVEFCFMSSVDSNLLPLNTFLSFGKSQKSFKAKSGGVESLTNGWYIMHDEECSWTKWAGVLSWQYCQFFAAHMSSNFHCTTSWRRCSSGFLLCVTSGYSQRPVVIKGRKIESTEDLKQNTIAYFYNIQKRYFLKHFQQWQKCCIDSKGKYFEGD